MRILSFLSSFLFLATIFVYVAAETEVDTAEPIEDIAENVDDGAEIAVAAIWPEDNPFGHVVNGERNTINIVFESKTDKNVTVHNIAGSIHHPETDKLIKNLTALNYGLPMFKGAKIQLPYAFYSELKPGDARLYIWVEHSINGEKERALSYDSIVSIVEPETSFFDFKTLSTYLIVSAFLGGLSYFAYLSFVPQSKKSRTRKPDVSAPVGTVTATGAGGYQEEWIPDHHLKKNKSKKGSGNVTSGDELSGGEMSGTEGAKKRKGRKQ